MKLITALLFSWIAAIPFVHAASFKVSKEWKADAGTEFELISREQDFKVEVWDNETIRIDFVLETKDADITEEDFKKGLKISSEKTNNKLSIKTSMEMESSSVWKWIFNDKKCKSGCVVNNTVYLPKHLAYVSFSFNYCTLKIGEVNLPLKISSTYGEVSIGKNANRTILNASYSDIVIGTLSHLKVSGSYSDFILKTIDTLTIASNYGEIKLGDCKLLQSLNLNYADINIDKAGFIKLNATYSDIIVNYVYEEINANLTYSDLKVNGIAKNITGIGINGVYADCTLKINPEHPINIAFNGVYSDVKVKNTQMIVSKKEEKNNILDLFLKTKTAVSTSPLIKMNGKRCGLTIL